MVPACPDCGQVIHLIIFFKCSLLQWGSLENFVTQEFLCPGVNELFSRREGTSEVEYLIEIHGKIVDDMILTK